MNTTKGQTETPSSVAVGAPGSGGLKARLDAIATKLNGATADTALEVTKWALPRIADLAADAIEAAEQREARAERYRIDAEALGLLEKHRLDLYSDSDGSWMACSEQGDDAPNCSHGPTPAAAIVSAVAALVGLQAPIPRRTDRERRTTSELQGAGLR